jgi:hypothetical protein
MRWALSKWAPHTPATSKRGVFWGARNCRIIIMPQLSPMMAIRTRSSAKILSSLLMT